MNEFRKEYTLHGLYEFDLHPSPFMQFHAWFEQARGGMAEPNAMTLATATADGRPSARTVLLKGYDEHGFVLYTNYESRKGMELQQNPWAALLFYWPHLERQVRIEGRVGQVEAAESDAYFQSRPAGSRLGAWASPQSQVIASREVLEQNLEQLTARYGDENISRPPHWGGYRVSPLRFEFWQGRPNRLHDRLCYVLNSDGTWRIERLAP
ncbi:MAG: pyridoxamine 5'-phosphate oxidase [Chloroflexaceae bacterium]|nr:pyridoxamine 5'-phosphate oxidase [Chloroflexaceae bacterium]